MFIYLFSLSVKDTQRKIASTCCFTRQMLQHSSQSKPGSQNSVQVWHIRTDIQGCTSVGSWIGNRAKLKQALWHGTWASQVASSPPLHRTPASQLSVLVMELAASCFRPSLHLLESSDPMRLRHWWKVPSFSLEHLVWSIGNGSSFHLGGIWQWINNEFLKSF